MKGTWSLGVVLLLGLALNSCFDPPEYSVIPEIEFQNIVFVDVPDVVIDPLVGIPADTLVLFINFRDGDGDLGLDSEKDNQCFLNGNDTICYNEKNYFVLTSTGEPVNYKVKRTIPELGLPDFIPPYTCTNWEVIFDDPPGSQTAQPLDTLYFELNQDHYNIFVDFLVKQNDGSFQEFDWRTEFCTTYDGRFPIVAKNSDLSLKSPVEGTLRYAMPSVGFKLQFSIKTLKLRVQIQDRLLNKSNIIETPEFQFK